MIEPTPAAAARTVADAAEHLDRMKQAALDLRDATGGPGGANERAYFTPTEDEQIRHLLITYCQWRAALFDLIHRARADGASYESVDRLTFATALAAAALLVDAARFLRDTWNDDALAVRKLNEAEPHFGIGPGTYDAVQKSLTDPLHAWMIYRATAYYDRIRPQLAADASIDDSTARVLAVLQRYVDRVRVSPAAYARARALVRSRQLITHVTGGPLARAFYAIQSSASRLCSRLTTSPGHRPALPPAIREAIAQLLRPGDVIIVRKEHAVTNYFLPGYWPHAALYLGDADDLRRLRIDRDEHVARRWSRIELPPQLREGGGDSSPPQDAERRRVLEAMADGVLLRSIASPLASDAIAVIRPTLDEADVARAIARGIFHEGKSYDFDFDFTRSDRMVCTGVVYRSFEGIGPMRFKLTRRAGRLTLAAEDLLAMARRRECFTPVACYCPRLGTAVHLADAVDIVLDATMGRPAFDPA